MVDFPSEAETGGKRQPCKRGLKLSMLSGLKTVYSYDPIVMSKDMPIGSYYLNPKPKTIYTNNLYRRINMEPKIHEFNDSLKNGHAGEWVINRYHAKYYIVREATMKEQYQGIDAVYTSKQSGTVYKIEIKTDFMTAKTDNIAIELVSNTSTGKGGWAVTSQSDYIIYYLWDLWIVFYFNTKELAELVPHLKTSYPIKPAQNNGYQSMNILVPVMDAKSISLTERAPVNAYWIKENYIQWINQ